MFWKETGYFDVAAERKPLLHLWSLGIEEQFYIVFPLVLYGLWKKNLRLATFLVLLAWVSYQSNLVIYKKAPGFDFYSPVTRFWELFAGVLLALWERRGLTSTNTPDSSSLQSERLRRIFTIAQGLSNFTRSLFFRDAALAQRQGTAFRSFLSLLGLLLLAIALYKAKTEHFPGKQALFPVLGAVCLIAAGANAWCNRVLLACKPAVWIGLISYPLYLWHWPLISYTRIILGNMPGRGFRLGLVAAAVLLATLTYWLVERPIRFGKRVRKAKMAALVVMLIAILCAGMYVKYEKGIPSRKAAITGTAFLPQIDWHKIAAGTPCPKFAEAEPAPYRTGFLQCRYHAVGGKQTVAIIGDSHAQVAFDALARHNAQLGLNTLLLMRHLHDNPIVAHYVNGSWDTPESNRAFADWSFNVLTQNPNLDKVFIFMHSVYIIDTLGEKNYREAIQTAVDRLHAAGKNVFLVVDNPLLPFDIRDAIAAQPLRPPVPARYREKVWKKDVQPQQQRQIVIWRAIQNARIIDTLDAFCPTDECPLLDQSGQALYFDDNHLAPAGSRLLVEEVLKPWITAPAAKN
jgi:peptidoglycan/LPS O-acetylase OafA/YrhL